MKPETKALCWKCARMDKEAIMAYIKSVHVAEECERCHERNYVFHCLVGQNLASEAKS